MCEVRTETALTERSGIPSGIVLQKCKNETAKSLLGARTKQKIGLNTSRNSVKSSSLDPGSNVVDRQMITEIQNSAYSLAST